MTRSSKIYSSSHSSHVGVIADAKQIKAVPFRFGVEEGSKSDDALTDEDAEAIVNCVASKNTDMFT